MIDPPDQLIATLLAHPEIFKILSGRTRGDFVRSLRKYEWSLGNGQCPLCYGTRYPTAQYIAGNRSEGHREGCVLSKAMGILGIHNYHSHTFSEEECRYARQRNKLEIRLSMHHLSLFTDRPKT